MRSKAKSKAKAPKQRQKTENRKQSSNSFSLPPTGGTPVPPENVLLPAHGYKNRPPYRKLKTEN
jgi:hypothetical protein